MGGGSDKLSSKMCKAPVKSFTTNKPTASFFTGQMCFLWPNQQCQSTVACLQSQMKTKNSTANSVVTMIDIDIAIAIISNIV